MNYPKTILTPQGILAEDGLLRQLTKAVIERCLETELDTHLGYFKHARAGTPTGAMGTARRTSKASRADRD